MSINNHFADLIPKQNQEDNFFSDLVPSAPQLGSATLGAAVGSVKAPYKWGGVDPVKGMDCSGATCYVAKQFGVQIPRTSIEQYKDKRAVSVSKDQLQPGDLVFFDTGVSKEKGRQVEGGKYVTHVGIYVGNGEFMHQSGDKQAGMSRAKLSHWQNKYIGAKRHAQINQQVALRGIPVPAEQRGLPQPTLRDVAKGIQQEDAQKAEAIRRGEQLAGIRRMEQSYAGDPRVTGLENVPLPPSSITQLAQHRENVRAINDPAYKEGVARLEFVAQLLGMPASDRPEDLALAFAGFLPLGTIATSLRKLPAVQKLAKSLSTPAALERFAASLDNLPIPTAQKQEIIEAVAPKVKPKTVKPKTIVDPELAAARKGMEGRQPRTAPVEVKPKVTPEAKESAPKGLRDSEQYQATIDEIKAQETNLETARSQVLSRIDKIEQSLKDPRSVKGIAQREALRKIRDAVQNATPSGEVVMPTFLKIKRGGQSFEVPTYGLMEQFGLTSERGLKNTRWFLREQVTINDAGTNYVFYKGQPGASKPEPTAPKATPKAKEPKVAPEAGVTSDAGPIAKPGSQAGSEAGRSGRTISPDLREIKRTNAIATPKGLNEHGYGTFLSTRDFALPPSERGDRFVLQANGLVFDRLYAKSITNPGAAGDPWVAEFVDRLNKSDYNFKDGRPPGGRWTGDTVDIGQTRREAVEQALKEGKPVSAEVLADYPDLDPNYDPGKPLDIVGMGKPKTIGEVVEPKVTPTDSMRRALVAHGGFSEKQIDALAASLNPIIEQNPGAVFKAVKKIDPSGKLLQEWAQPFYSKLEQVAREKIPNRAPAEQIRKTLIAAGVKPEEMTWTRMDELLDRGGTISKQDLLDHLQENQVRIDEVMKGANNPYMVKLGEIEDNMRGLQDSLHDKLMANGMGYAEANRTAYELIWSDVGDFRKQNYPPDIRAILADADALRGPYVEMSSKWSKVKSDPTKFGHYTLPGGEDYRELLLTLPPKPKPEMQAAMEYYTHFVQRGGESPWRALSPEQQRAIAESMPSHARNAPDSDSVYRGSHWDEPNVLAHIRFDTRKGPNGEKILHVAEIQSDWHQKGRKEGYAGTAEPTEALPVGDIGGRYWEIKDQNGKFLVNVGTDGSLGNATPEQALAAAREKIAGGYKRTGEVPDAPFKKNWHELAMKRVLRYAAENDFDRVSWDTGITNAERYDLSKQVDSIKWYDPRGKVSNPVGVREVTIEMPNSNGISLAVDESGKVVTGTHAEFNGKSIDDVVGKEIAQKIMDNDAGDLSGDGLKVGGEGMKGFYDKILPETANKMGKRFGARVEAWEIDSGTNANNKQFSMSPRYQELMRQRDTLAYGTPEYYANTDQLLQLERESISAPAHSIAITPEMKASLLGEGQPLFQQGKEGIKGAYNPSTRVIELVKGKADVSTVIHEVAHDWHGFLKDHAEFGPTIRQAYGDSVEGAEKFARHFEGFLRTGKAPSKPLAQVFTAIREWMAKIYAQFSGGKAPKEVEAIFKKAYENPSEETLRLAKEFDAKYAPKAEPKPTGKSTGIRAETLDAEAAQGLIDEVERGLGLSKQKAREIGTDAVKNGADFEEIAQGIADKTVPLTGDNFATVMEGKRILMRELFQHEEFTPEFKAAKARLNQYIANFKKGQTEWHRIGVAMQGEVDIDTGDIKQVVRAREEILGRELTSKEREGFEKIIDEQRKTITQLEAKKKELESAKADAVVRELRRVPRKASIEQIRAERKQLFQDVKDILAEAKKNQVVGAGLGVFQAASEAAPELAKKVLAILKTYLDEFNFITHKEFAEQLAKDFPELGATEDDVRRVLAGVGQEPKARPLSEWQKIKGESRKIENRTSKLQEQEGVLRTGITVARDKRVIQKSEEVQRLDAMIKANEKQIRIAIADRDAGFVSKTNRVIQSLALLNPIARVVDVASNTTKMAAYLAQNPARTLMQAGSRQIGKESLITWAKLKNVLEGAPSRWKEEVKITLSGRDMDTLTKWGTPSLGSKVSGVTDVPFRDIYYRLAADDYAVSYAKKMGGNKEQFSTNRQAIFDQLTAGTDGPLSQTDVEAAKGIAHEWSLRQTYNNDNVVSTVMGGAKSGAVRMAEKANGKVAAEATALAFDTVTRFNKVITNVVLDRINYTPVGVIEGSLRALAKNKKMQVNDLRLISDLASKGLVGTALVVAGYKNPDLFDSIADFEIVTTEGGYKFLRWRLFPQVAGGLDMTQFSGFVPPYILGAAFAKIESVPSSELTDKQKDALKKKLAWDWGVSTPLAGNLKDVASLADPNENTGKKLGQLAARQVVPSAASEIATRTDEVELRKTSSFWDAFVNRVPWWRKTLPSNVKQVQKVSSR